MVIIVFVAAALFIAGLAINLLAPLIAAVIMMILAYYLAWQAFYFAVGVYLLPAQIPLLIFTNWKYWWGDSGVFEACYTSPLAWICSTLFYAAIVGLVCLPAFCADFRKGTRSFRQSNQSSGAQAPRARIEPVLALPAPVALTGRDAVAAMCRTGNAAALAKLRGGTSTAATAAFANAPQQPTVLYHNAHTNDADPDIEDILASIRRILGEDDPGGYVPPPRESDMARATGAMQSLNQQVEDLVVEIERREYQQRQQHVIARHIQCAREPEPEPGLLASIHGSLTSVVRGVGYGVAVSGGAVLGAGIITNRRHPLG